jgi:hypothetical protein
MRAPRETWPSLYARGLTLREIAAAAGKPFSQVREMLLLSGVALRPGGRRPTKRKARRA